MKRMGKHDGIIKILLGCALLLAPMLLGILIFCHPWNSRMTIETSASAQTGFWDRIQEEHEVTFLDYDGNVLAQYSVKHGECLRQVPSLSEEGYVFFRWDIPLYSNLDITEYPIMEDMTISPVSIEQRIPALNALAIANITAEEVDVEALKSFIEEVKQKGAANEREP